MPGGFSICEFRGQRAVKYYHNYGDFEFLLIQAGDGTKDIVYHVTVPGMTELSVRKIGNEAMSQLHRTATLLKYNIKGDNPNFDDIIQILTEAKHYMQQRRMAKRAKATSTQVKATQVKA